MSEPTERHRVQINYRSGQSMVIECDSFSATKKGGIATFEWVAAVPTPLYMGADYIESVWQLDE